MTAPLTLEDVLKRNSVERLKKEKHPLDVVQELPALMQRSYEEISEEDMVRFQWYGLYHDKPKVGFFMMRIKVPGGILSPAGLRAIGQISVRFGRNFGELTTRQNVQVHWVELRQLPAIFELLDEVGLNVRGGCGDTVRNITGCPVAGLDRDELFDARPVVEAAAGFFYGNREYSDLPRKHKITIAACRHQCNAPDINCISLIGVLHEGRPGFAVRVGGGLSTVPRIARDLGVFVELEEALPVLRAIIDVWKESLKYRMSRVKARLKFMVDDVGPEAYRALVEERLGRKLESYAAPPADSETEHIGAHRQTSKDLFYVGFPVNLGLMRGEQMLRIADLADGYGGDIRLTRQQNFILTGIPAARLEEVVAAVEEIGYRLDVNRIRASSIACTGSPLCNYAVARTKGKLDEILGHLEREYGRRTEGIRVNLDGCPHSCCHHWVGDVGLQGTTLKERGAGGEKLEGYDLYLRGGLGPDAAIGRPVIRRVAAGDVAGVVGRLVGAYLDGRAEGERFKGFCDRHTDQELIAIANAKTNGHANASADANANTNANTNADGTTDADTNATTDASANGPPVTNGDQRPAAATHAHV
jgi:sulfite reductase beta subunit-like hemoprotein